MDGCDFKADKRFDLLGKGTHTMNTITTKKDTQISCNHWGSGTYIGL